MMLRMRRASTVLAGPDVTFFSVAPPPPLILSRFFLPFFFAPSSCPLYRSAMYQRLVFILLKTDP